jgi:hypothetical protein
MLSPTSTFVIPIGLRHKTSSAPTQLPLRSEDVEEAYCHEYRRDPAGMYVRRLGHAGDCYPGA